MEIARQRCLQTDGLTRYRMLKTDFKRVEKMSRASFNRPRPVKHIVDDRGTVQCELTAYLMRHARADGHPQQRVGTHDFQRPIGGLGV